MFFAKIKMTSLICAAAVITILSGCGHDVIRDNGDEIRLSDWAYINEDNNTSIRLSFDGDNGEFSIVTDERSLDIEGLCLIDDGSLTIIAPDDKYVFKYTLKGNTLTLEYDGGALDLLRQ